MVSSPQHEPTMEEILASIRKIISEDSPEAQPQPPPQPAPEPPRPAPAPPAQAMAAEADVLELTQEIEEAPPAPAPAPAPVPEPVRQAPPPPPENDVVFEPIEQAPPAAPEPVAPVHSAEGIFSEKTRKALDDAFASIEPEPEESFAHAQASAPSVEGLSVEAVFERAVRESFAPVVNQWLGSNADAIVERMKPLIREWMDEHFPALLEGAVRDEVARVARARGTKR